MHDLVGIIWGGSSYVRLLMMDASTHKDAEALLRFHHSQVLGFDNIQPAFSGLLNPGIDLGLFNVDPQYTAALLCGCLNKSTSSAEWQTSMVALLTTTSITMSTLPGLTSTSFEHVHAHDSWRMIAFQRDWWCTMVAICVQWWTSSMSFAGSLAISDARESVLSYYTTKSGSVVLYALGAGDRPYMMRLYRVESRLSDHNAWWPWRLHRWRAQNCHYMFQWTFCGLSQRNIYISFCIEMCLTMRAINIREMRYEPRTMLKAWYTTKPQMWSISTELLFP